MKLYKVIILIFNIVFILSCANPAVGSTDEEEDLEDIVELDDPDSGLFGSSGGTYITDSGVTITVPQNALDDIIQLSVTTHSNAASLSNTCDVAAILDGIELEPHGTVFNTPITIQWPISDERFTPGESYSLIYFNSDENLWLDEGFQGSVDENGDYFTCSLTHFSPYGTLPGISGNLGDYFNESTNPQVSLGNLMADYLINTNLMSFESTDGEETYIVARIDFDIQYSINGVEGQAQSSYPPNAPTPSADAKYMSISYSEDVMSNAGVQNVKGLLVTVILKKVPTPYNPVANHCNIFIDTLAYTDKISVNIYYSTDMDPDTTQAATSFSPTLTETHIGPQLVLNYRTEFVMFLYDTVDKTKTYTLKVSKEAMDIDKKYPLPKDYEVTFVPNEIIANGNRTIYFD